MVGGTGVWVTQDQPLSLANLIEWMVMAMGWCKGVWCAASGSSEVGWGNIGKKEQATDHSCALLLRLGIWRRVKTTHLLGRKMTHLLKVLYTQKVTNLYGKVRYPL